jgi:hypothetical protein
MSELSECNYVRKRVCVSCVVYLYAWRYACKSVSVCVCVCVCCMYA